MGYKLATAFVDVQARGMGTIDKMFGSIKSQLSSLGNLLGTFGVPLGLAAMTAAAFRFVGAATESYDAEAKLRAVIETTGRAAGKSAEDILKLADSMQAMTTFDDEAITNAASKLLTFKKVVGSTFDRSLKLAADLAAVGFGSIEGAAVQLGKALEDPVRGIGALRRAGVSFSEAEKKMIKQLVQSGQLLKAQEIILAGVAGQVEGVAAAMAKTPAGQWKQINNELGNVSEELGKRILPLFNYIGRAVLDASKGLMAMVDTVYSIAAAFNGWPIKLLAVGAIILSIVTGVGLIPAVIFTAIAFAKELGISFQWVGEQIGHLVEWVQVFATHWQAVWQIISNGIAIVVTDFGAVASAGAYAFGYIAGAATKSMIGFMVWLAGQFQKIAVSFATMLTSIAMQVPVLAQAIAEGNLKGAAKAFAKLSMGIVKDAKAMTDSMGVGSIDAALKAMIGFKQGLLGVGETPDFGFSDENKKRIEEINKLMAELVDAKKKLEEGRGDPFKLPQMPKKLADMQKDGTVTLDIKGGLGGLTAAWSTLQEAMLKRESPQEKMVDALGNIEEAGDKQLEEQIKTNSLLERGLVPGAIA